MKVAIVLFFAIGAGKVFQKYKASKHTFFQKYVGTYEKHIFYDLAQALDWGASVDPIKCYDNTLNPDDTGKEVDCPSETCLKVQGKIYLKIDT